MKINASQRILLIYATQNKINQHLICLETNCLHLSSRLVILNIGKIFQIGRFKSNNRNSQTLCIFAVTTKNTIFAIKNKTKTLISLTQITIDAFYCALKYFKLKYTIITRFV